VEGEVTMDPAQGGGQVERERDREGGRGGSGPEMLGARRGSSPPSGCAHSSRAAAPAVWGGMYKDGVEGMQTMAMRGG
jgi:hypothetical protein